MENTVNNLTVIQEFEGMLSSCELTINLCDTINICDKEWNSLGTSC